MRPARYFFVIQLSNSRAAALDTDLGTGGIREQIENVRRLLGIQARYDGSRLRER